MNAAITTEDGFIQVIRNYEDCFEDDVPNGKFLGMVCDSQFYGDNCNCDCYQFRFGICGAVSLADGDGRLWHVVEHA